jgi:hypothetical protein
MPFKGRKAFIEIHQREYDMMCFRGWQPRSVFPGYEEPKLVSEYPMSGYAPGDALNGRVIPSQLAELRNLERRLNEHLDFKKKKDGSAF